MTALLDLTCFLLPLSFLPGLVSGATAPRWALLAVTLPFLLWRTDLTRVPHLSALLALLAYCAASLLWSEVRLDGYMEFWHVCLLCAAFAVGTQYDLRKPVTLMATATALMLPLVLLQAAGYTGLSQVASPAGLFYNKNVLGETASALLVFALLERSWLVAAALSAICLLAQEKAAFFGLGAVAVVYLWNRQRIAAIAALCVGFAALLHYLPQPTAQARFDVWLDALQGLMPLGHGVGSFYAAFPAAASHVDLMVIRPEQAHNEFLHYLFELGAGAGLLGYLAWRSLQGTWEAGRLVLACILAQSLFAFPLHMPVTAFIAALVAGGLCRAEPEHGGRQYAGGAVHA